MFSSEDNLYRFACQRDKSIYGPPSNTLRSEGYNGNYSFHHFVSSQTSASWYRTSQTQFSWNNDLHHIDFQWLIYFAA
jgi:hypothetical protein